MGTGGSTTTRTTAAPIPPRPDGGMVRPDGAVLTRPDGGFTVPGRDGGATRSDAGFTVPGLGDGGFTAPGRDGGGTRTGRG